MRENKTFLEKKMTIIEEINEQIKDMEKEIEETEKLIRKIHTKIEEKELELFNDRNGLSALLMSKSNGQLFCSNELDSFGEKRMPEVEKVNERIQNTEKEIRQMREKTAEHVMKINEEKIKLSDKRRFLSLFIVE